MQAGAGVRPRATMPTGGSDDVGFSVQVVPEGGFSVAGCTSSCRGGGEDGYLIRLNAAGETMWTRLYGGPEPDRF